MTGTTAVPASPEVLRLELSDELVSGNRHRLKQHVVDAIAEGRPNVLLDGSRCGYIDSSGLGVLVSCSRKCRDAGGALVITGLYPELREWIGMLKLDLLLDVR